MPAFRYAQCCPLARATEILGERWTLLVVRELLLGGKRFSDLERALAGISTSVLAARLAALERRGLVARRELPPPTPATLYELTASGRALLPVIIELARWGSRFLGAPEPGDHIEPDWVRLGLITFASREPTPARRYNITVPGDDRDVVFHVAGGDRGTAVGEGHVTADASIRGGPLDLFALAAGLLAPDEAIRSRQIGAEGDLAALSDFSALFDMRATEAGTDAQGAGSINS